ncbi:acyl carrier protein [Paenibacillus glucanolyticus]|uniref:acyl carrier protein n=1 Tax=Paenibacillus glucanolyticus TaxID=59843 RepID=UPI00368824FD
MSQSEVESKLKKLIIDTLGDELSLDNLEPEDKFEELGINSVIFIKTVVMIEGTFDIEFEDDDLDVNNFVDLKSLTKHVYSKINAI